MKVIDLMYGLLPDKIKVNGKIWTLCNNEYHICDDYGYDYWLEHKDDKFEEDVNLSDEIEIYTPLKYIKDTPKEDKKIKRIEERESGWWPNMADGNVSTLKQAINEIIDKVNGEDNEE